MKNPKLGANAPIKIDTLVQSRLLLQANSGAGKSWALRRLLEQTHSHIQHIVIDVEDEFHTLREKYDYVLAGRHGGDCPANVRCAPLLATRLLELGVSAIIGIYELKRHEQYRFVKLFLNALISAPRKLWRPALVVVDESHLFAPQTGSAESAGAVIDLMTRGRKRGFCGVLATQRISKLHKDAAAEANNVLIGRCSLDVDMKRAADALGWSDRKQIHQLRKLKPGEFYAFGNALGFDGVEKIKVGSVATTHPKAGTRHVSVKPATGKIKKVLSQLASLPEEAEQKAKTIKEMQDEISALKRQIKAPLVEPQQVKELQRKAHTLLKDRNMLQKCLENIVFDSNAQLGKVEAHIRAAVNGALKGVTPITNFEGAKTGRWSFADIPNKSNPPKKFTTSKEASKTFSKPSKESSNGTHELGKCERAILRVLSQHDTRTKTQVALISGYSHKSGGFNNALSKLRSAHMIEGPSDSLVCTTYGHEAVGDVDPLPTGEELLVYWCGQRAIGKCGATILRVLAEAPTNTLSKATLAQESGYSATSGGFNNALSKLRTLALIIGSKEIALSEDLI